MASIPPNKQAAMLYDQAELLCQHDEKIQRLEEAVFGKIKSHAVTTTNSTNNKSGLGTVRHEMLGRKHENWCLHDSGLNESARNEILALKHENWCLHELIEKNNELVGQRGKNYSWCILRPMTYAATDPETGKHVPQYPFLYRGFGGPSRNVSWLRQDTGKERVDRYIAWVESCIREVESDRSSCTIQ